MTDDRRYLQHIQEAVRRIREYTRDGRTNFEADTRTQDSVIRNLEVIGEAVRNLSEKLRAAHPAIPWKRIAGIRDTLIQRYFRIDFELVWQVIEVHLPVLAGRSKRCSSRRWHRPLKHLPL